MMVKLDPIAVWLVGFVERENRRAGFRVAVIHEVPFGRSVGASEVVVPGTPKPFFKSGYAAQGNEESCQHASDYRAANGGSSP
jgi:hypothetical protein